MQNKKRLFASLRDRIFPRRNRKITQRFALLSTGESFSFAQGRDLLQSDIVASAVKPYASLIGKLELKHLRGEEEMPDANIKFLITDSPNEMETMQKLIEKAIIERMIEGNSYIHIKREHGEVESLYFLKPESVELREQEKQLFLDFSFADGTNQTIAYRNIIHLRNEAGNEFFGASPAPRLKQIMGVLDATDGGVIAAIKNSFIVRYIVKIVGSARPEDVERITKNVQEQFLSEDFGGVVGTDDKYEIEPVTTNQKIYMPEHEVHNKMTKRVQNFFNVNEKIISGEYTEDEYQAWYELYVEPIVKELCQEFTRKIFSRRERGHANKIVVGTNVGFASLKTKLQMVTLFDRSVLSANEFREELGRAPLKKDFYISRLDTAVFDVMEDGSLVYRARTLEESSDLNKTNVNRSNEDGKGGEEVEED